MECFGSTLTMFLVGILCLYYLWFSVFFTWYLQDITTRRNICSLSGMKVTIMISRWDPCGDVWIVTWTTLEKIASGSFCIAYIELLESLTTQKPQEIQEIEQFKIYTKIECQMIVLSTFYLILRCEALDFIIQMKPTLSQFSSTLNFILMYLLQSYFVVFQLYCSYVLVQTFLLSKNSIKLVYLFRRPYDSCWFF